MKRSMAFALAALILLSLLSGCASTTEDIAARDQQQAEASGLTIHKIGVATYNVQDAQIMMFKSYLDDYIKECFPDVTFLYSSSISSGDEMMEFLQTCADEGAEGVMLFYTCDFKKEVEFCQSKGMYCIRASGNVADDVFASVESNPYFLGEIGPGSQTEYDEAAKMTEALASAGDDGSFVILSGGACMGNEMHRLRTVAILDTLQRIYGANFHLSSETLAVVSEPTPAEADGLKIMICPGYMEIPGCSEAASDAIVSGDYSVVLSSIPVTPLMDALNASAVHCGVVDCFSEDNFFGFKKDKVAYVAGKYQSEIGPAFAALYNAITGNADAYRVDGKAFRLHQGFWTAADSDEYDRMYALANGAAINAYSYEDLYSVVKQLNPEADFASFKALTESFDYDSCLARRSR